jgi:sortase (surface protein transpeptidase)
MRPAAVVAVLGVVLTLGTPAGWLLTRPDAAAGPPVGRTLVAPVPSSEPGVASGERAVVRDAAPQPRATAAVPVRLAIPDLGVDVALDPVGVDADGQLQIPDDVDRAGWYRFGPVPGGPGNAVVAGHVDDAEQGLGALAPLREAAVGTEVVVSDDSVRINRWRIVSRELIAKETIPLDTLFSRSGSARLVILTCGGPFDVATRHYRDNVVVVAEPLQ